MGRKFASRFATVALSKRPCHWIPPLPSFICVSPPRIKTGTTIHSLSLALPSPFIYKVSWRAWFSCQRYVKGTTINCISTSEQSDSLCFERASELATRNLKVQVLEPAKRTRSSDSTGKLVRSKGSERLLLVCAFINMDPIMLHVTNNTKCEYIECRREEYDGEVAQRRSGGLELSRLQWC